MNAPGPKPPIVVTVPAGSIAFYPEAALGGHTQVRVFVGSADGKRGLAGVLTLRNEEVAIIDGLLEPDAQSKPNQIVIRTPDGGPLLDPDCRAGKHGSCVGGSCECGCHR